MAVNQAVNHALSPALSAIEYKMSKSPMVHTYEEAMNALQNDLVQREGNSSGNGNTRRVKQTSSGNRNGPVGR